MTRFNLQPVIGLEIHAQLLCKRKLFSPSIVSCRNPLPNTTVTLYDAAFPGTLPRLCAEPVRLAIRAGLAFQGTINCKSRFVRKHYFYGDMPAGYQITQQDSPIVSNGLIALDDGTSVRIERIQIEQDSGKTVTDLHSDFNFLDLNRAGVPLIEIVTAPDLNDSHRAVQVVRELQHVLTFLNICDGVMANGNLRVDVNVSVKDLEKPGFSSQRVEVKNLNSLKSIKKAIDYEVERQTDVIYNGGRVAQETRGFDVCLGFTHVLRSKELARDYRIFNDPDLPLLNIGNDFITSVVKSMPELPRSAAKRLQEQYNISEATAKILSSDRDVLDYFERALAIHPIHEDTPSIAANWLINEMFGRLTAANIPFVSNPVDVENFRQLVDVLQSGSVSGSAGKSILDILMEGKFNNVSDIVTAQGLNQVSDASVLRPYCLKVIKRFPQEVSDYVVKGNKRKLNFLISETRKIVGDQANMSSVRSVLHGLLTDDQKR